MKMNICVYQNSKMQALQYQLIAMAVQQKEQLEELKHYISIHMEQDGQRQNSLEALPASQGVLSQ